MLRPALLPRLEFPDHLDLNAQALATGEIHLWRLPLAGPDENLGPLLADLSVQELARARRFKTVHDQQCFALAHAGMRRVLSLYLDIPARAIAFGTGTGGKPNLARPGQSLSFNLSHSGKWALLAVARNCEVGVDIEALRHMPHALRLAHRFLGAEALDTLHGLEGPELDQAFLLCWTRFEAELKAGGEGLFGARKQSPATFPVWQLSSYVPADGYFASLAAERAGLRLCTASAAPLVA